MIEPSFRAVIFKTVKEFISEAPGGSSIRRVAGCTRLGPDAVTDGPKPIASSVPVCDIHIPAPPPACDRCSSLIYHI